MGFTIEDYQKQLCFLSLSLLLSLGSTAYALTYAMPEAGDDIVGQIQIIKIKAGNNLHRLAREYDVGYNELIAANPTINPKNLIAGTKIIIPTAFVLPEAPRVGIVINLAEMRLYYYPNDDAVVMTYPIGIGREGWETPLSTTYVNDKEEFPYWYVPESIRAHVLKTKGKLLPKIVSPGPNNPLGDFAIRLALRGYLIHSTNNPKSVGKRSSSGCIRMYPKDAEELFAYVKLGTPVHIIHDPYKIGWYQKELYMEAHLPLPNYYERFIDHEIVAVTKGINSTINWGRTSKTAREHVGYPVFIGKEITIEVAS